MNPDDIPTPIKTKQNPDIHWSFKCHPNQVNLGKIIKEVEDDGGVIAIAKTETETYIFVVCSIIAPAWVYKHGEKPFPSDYCNYISPKYPATKDWVRWLNPEIDPIQLLNEYRAKTQTTVRTTVLGYK